VIAGSSISSMATAEEKAALSIWRSGEENINRGRSININNGVAASSTRRNNRRNQSEIANNINIVKIISVAS